MRPARVLLRGSTPFRHRLDPVHPRRWVECLTALTDSEKIDTRRHCGYPAYGGTAAGFSSWRFYQVYGLLEFRMNNLADGEICVLRKYLASLVILENSI